MSAALAKCITWTVGLTLVLIAISVLWPKQLRSETKHKRKVPLGIEFICSNQVCVAFSANLEAGDFFRGIRSKKTDHGVEFRKGSTVVTTFPAKVSVTILAAIGECAASHDCSDGNRFSFDDDFMKSIQFKVFWKQGFRSDSADMSVLAATRIANPTPIAEDADWWRYDLEVGSSNVSLDESIVVEVLSPKGQLVTRFSGHL